MPWKSAPRNWERTRIEIMDSHLTRADVDTLATYNSECHRGIAHTPEWDARMADLQARFDRAIAQVRAAFREGGQ